MLSCCCMYKLPWKFFGSVVILTASNGSLYLLLFQRKKFLLIKNNICCLKKRVSCVTCWQWTNALPYRSNCARLPIVCKAKRSKNLSQSLVPALWLVVKLCCRQRLFHICSHRWSICIFLFLRWLSIWESSQVSNNMFIFGITWFYPAIILLLLKGLIMWKMK